MSKKKVFSFLKGYAFSFEDEGNNIQAWFSALSGLEKVYVNGDLVTSQRNYSKKSSLSFSISGNSYTRHMEVTSLLKGPFVCTLTKNSRILQRQKLIFSRPETKVLPFFKKLWIWVIIGVAAGVMSSILNLPDWTFYVFTAIVFFSVFSYYAKCNSGSTPVIIEEESVMEEDCI